MQVFVTAKRKKTASTNMRFHFDAKQPAFTNLFLHLYHLDSVSALPGRLSPVYDKYGYSGWGTYSRRHDFSRSTAQREEHGHGEAGVTR